MSVQNLKVVIASDVSSRDGIGVEVSVDDELILEIFRDDTKKTRELTLYKKDVPLEIVEESIAIFKKEIPWDFIEYVERPSA
jgi:hypothetical protein